MSRTGQCQSRFASQHSSVYTGLLMVDLIVQSKHRSDRVAHLLPMNLAVILQGIRPATTILPLSSNRLKVFFATSLIIVMVKIHAGFWKYLNPDLLIIKMYDLYMEKCRQEKRDTICNEWLYRQLLRRMRRKGTNYCVSGVSTKQELSMHITN